MNAYWNRRLSAIAAIVIGLTGSVAVAQQKVRVTREGDSPRPASRDVGQRSAPSRSTSRSAGGSIRHSDRQQPQQRRTVQQSDAGRRDSGRDVRTSDRDRDRRDAQSRTRVVDRDRQDLRSSPRTIQRDSRVIDRDDRRWDSRARLSHRPRYGTVVRRPIATEYKRLSFGGRDYYRDSYNNFYLSISIGSDTHYQVCRPPYGVRVEYLPDYYETVVIGSSSYYYYDDVYYVREYDDGREVYVAIEPPIGATIYELPSDYDTVIIRDSRYYRVGSSYYRPYHRGNTLAYLRVSVNF